MEDDQEIHSPGTGSPATTRPNGRIAVTVASAPPQNTMALALPIQQPPMRNAGGNGGGGREDCWSEGATSVLIDAWGERYLELSRGNLKQKHWQDVADIVSSREHYTKTPKTDVQCKNRIDTVKKKYKTEKAKIASGGGSSKWPFYHRLDELIGPTAKIASPSLVTPIASSAGMKVPMGIPVGVRSVHQFQQQHQQQQQQQKQKQLLLLKRPFPIDSDGVFPIDSDGDTPSEPSRDSTDSYPPKTYERKRPRIQMNTARPGGGGGANSCRGERKGKDWGNSVRAITRAILKFGESYEQAESSKLQQLVEMEKQRMKFAKELELQRMQFFMKTQLELSQLKHRRVGSSNNHHSNNNTNNNNNNNNNSDSSS